MQENKNIREKIEEKNLCTESVLALFYQQYDNNNLHRKGLSPYLQKKGNILEQEEAIKAQRIIFLLSNTYFTSAKKKGYVDKENKESPKKKNQF